MNSRRIAITKTSRITAITLAPSATAAAAMGLRRRLRGAGRAKPHAGTAGAVYQTTLCACRLARRSILS